LRRQAAFAGGERGGGESSAVYQHRLASRSTKESESKLSLHGLYYENSKLKVQSFYQEKKEERKKKKKN